MSLSPVWLFQTPWTIQSLEFSWPEYWSRQPFPSSGDFPNPGIEPRSPTLRADSLPAEPQGKPKNTGVGNLSFLHGIFSTQESNQGLLHYRQILYQLSYQGSLVSHLILPNFLFHKLGKVTGPISQDRQLLSHFDMLTLLISDMHSFYLAQLS